MRFILQSASDKLNKDATFLFVAKQAQAIEQLRNERYMEAVKLWRQSAKLARNFKNREFCLHRADFLEAWGERIYQREQQGL